MAKKVAAIVMLVAILCSFGIFYPQLFMVVDYDDDMVIVETVNGDVYGFYDHADWEVGDLCAAVMYNNMTDEIWDDEILGVRYVGFLDLWVSQFCE